LSGEIDFKGACGVNVEADSLITSLDERIRRISREVLEQQHAGEQQPGGFVIVDAEARRLQQILQRIMSKEFISAKEAALLLNCSERHIHNLVDRARRQLGENPIPFRKIGETTTFLRTELLEWTRGQSISNQLRAVS
jgi:predicted ATP-grasp superfamily ATP-dependent carboligase